MTIIDVLVSIAVAAIVIGIIVYLRKHQATATAASADLTRAVDGLHRFVTAVELRLNPPAPAPAVEAAAAVPVVAGKAGQAGTFTFVVTGNPKDDIPAMNAAYLA